MKHRQAGDDQTDELGPPAGAAVDRRLREAPVDGEAAGDPGAEVRCAEADQLPVRVDLPLFSLGVDLRGPEALRKTDEHHSQGRSHQSPEAVEADVREIQRRQTGVDRADDRHSVSAEVE